MVLFGQYAITTTATPLSTAVSALSGYKFKQITVKNAKGAANLAYLGNSSVSTTANAGVELDANQGFTFYSGEGWLVDPSKIYIIGTASASNIAYVTGVL